jgi:hypothetical protein
MRKVKPQNADLMQRLAFAELHLHRFATGNDSALHTVQTHFGRSRPSA